MKGLEMPKARSIEYMHSFFDWVAEGKGEIIRVAEGDQRVWIERVDEWRIGDKWIQSPCVSIVDFNSEGRVVRWSDYCNSNWKNEQEGSPPILPTDYIVK